MSAGAADTRATGDRTARAVDANDHAVLWFVSHWALGVFVVVGTLSSLPILAPVLKASGHDLPARVIYLAYRLVCHQRPERSFHVLGEQMAVCERDIAIFLSGTVALGLFALTRSRWMPVAPRLLWPILLAVPMALDGGTQLVGLRESTWELRVITGTLFSLGAAWFAVPHLEAGFRDVERAMTSRLTDPATPTSASRGVVG